jgi:ribosome biogenesis GTPase A
MKLLFTILLSVTGFVLSDGEVTEAIINSIRQGKASELVKYFDEKVTIKLLNQEDVLSKSQAEANIKYFFEKHVVKNFSSVHVSSVNNTSQYITGTLETVNGKFRLSILIRRDLVLQFRIENDNE